MSDLGHLEYKALRDTIRERGSLRICTILVGLAAWAALSVGLLAVDIAGAATMIPFVVLAATFEISYFVHTGVERVGRYLQVFYEEPEGAVGWETTVMNFGARFPSKSDPLFLTLFVSAGMLNFVSSFVLTTRRPGWVVVSLAAHAWFAWRLFSARDLAASQRSRDLEHFRALRSAGTANPETRTSNLEPRT